MQKILYLITGLRLGGAEKQLLLLVNQMMLKGHRVMIVAMEPGGIMVKEFLQDNIQVDELKITAAKNALAGYKKFKKIVAGFEPDIIHSHMIHANLFAASFKLLNPRYKLICTAHNIREGSKTVMTVYFFIKCIANWTTNVSHEAYLYYIHEGYFNHKNSSFIPNAIDIQRFDPKKFDKFSIRARLEVPDYALVFFSAGRLHHQKNYSLLLRAFAKTVRRRPNALLYIAGEGNDLPQLEALCIELSITKSVFFLGRRDDITELMSMSDCFVLSSDFEGFGLVVAEAMALGLPVISTDCGGVKEVMGNMGILVNINDENGLFKAMATFKKTPSNKKSRWYIKENYGVDKVVKKWNDLYREL